MRGTQPGHGDGNEPADRGRAQGLTRLHMAIWDDRDDLQAAYPHIDGPDGAGYAFLADFVLDLDRRNPQTAARLLVSFRSWRALEEGRRAHAERALRRVAAAENLSTDTRDIVTRTLA